MTANKEGIERVQVIKYKMLKFQYDNVHPAFIVRLLISSTLDDRLLQKTTRKPLPWLGSSRKARSPPPPETKFPDLISSMKLAEEPKVKQRSILAISWLAEYGYPELNAS